MMERAWALFGNTPPGWQRVQAICDFVHRHIIFGCQYARATRSAAQAVAEQCGVCCDFSHLAVTFAGGLFPPCVCDVVAALITRHRAAGSIGGTGRVAVPMDRETVLARSNCQSKMIGLRKGSAQMLAIPFLN
jgi:hypothetical protein